MKVPQTDYDSYHHHQYQEIFLIWEASNYWRSRSDSDRDNIFFDPESMSQPESFGWEYPMKVLRSLLPDSSPSQILLVITLVFGLSRNEGNRMVHIGELKIVSP